MSIRITCPGCRKRFQVSDKFAGKKGPCPQCKTEISIPAKSEEVVVHEQESFGPKNVQGQATLKPLFREETAFSWQATAIVVGVVALLLGLAWMMRIFYSQSEDDIPVVIIGFGALLLAFPASFSGYTFLREDELQPYKGQELAIRVALCAVIYALIWGVYAFIGSYLFPETGFTIYHLVVVIPLMFAAGGGASHFCLDINFGNGALHYGFYFVVSILLRIVAGLSAF